MTVLDTAQMSLQTPQSPLAVARDERGVITLTLNDPGRFNALGSEMLVALPRKQIGILVGVAVIVINGYRILAG